MDTSDSEKLEFIKVKPNFGDSGKIKGTFALRVNRGNNQKVEKWTAK